MLQKIFLALATFWAVDQAIPFATFSKKSFCAMLISFHDDTKKIVVMANEKSVQEQMYHLGKLIRWATLCELKKVKGLWICDHWTGPNDKTFTVTTFHYVENIVWKLYIIDFNNHHGCTRGEGIFLDQKQVLEEYLAMDGVIMCVTYYR